MVSKQLALNIIYIENLHLGNQILTNRAICIIFPNIYYNLQQKSFKLHSTNQILMNPSLQMYFYKHILQFTMQINLEKHKSNPSCLIVQKKTHIKSRTY
jgi:hypothetical protein